MKRLAGGIVAAGLIFGFTPSVAHGQLHGMVVQNTSIGPGVMIGGDYARGLNDESGETNYFGARVGVGLPVVSFWGGVGAVKNGDSEVTFGGGGAIKVFQGPMVPVELSLQGGFGYIGESNGNLVNIPIGVALVIDVPSPAISVKPWGMPRIHIQSISPDVGDSQTEVGFGASGGLIVGAPNGLGVHATLDWMTIDYGFGSVTPLLFSIGVHYNISVPSLGVPMVPGM